MPRRTHADLLLRTIGEAGPSTTLETLDHLWRATGTVVGYRRAAALLSRAAAKGTVTRQGHRERHVVWSLLHETLKQQAEP